MREEDHTLVNYTVGYSKTIVDDPYVVDFEQTAWSEIYKHEADWKKRNGYT